MDKLLLIVTGSIAAVKTPDLVRELSKSGISTNCVLTNSAKNFVTETSLAYLSGNKTYSDMFIPEEEAEMAHIKLSRDADAILVAPCSADFIAKMANGLCNDLASTIYMASDKPVIIAPAMNPEMWQHKATKRNIKTLEKDGVYIINPEKGEMACGETGTGRMAEVKKITEYLKDKGFLNFKLQKKQTLKGRTCLITTGPTRESIDPVRYISNYSSGKQGYALAEEMADRGAKVYLISGPTNLEARNKNIEVINVESASEMLNAANGFLPVDFAICAAAVADWKPQNTSDQKIKKQKDSLPPMLELTENPDILFDISNKTGKMRPELVVGFAAETEHLIENAMVKLERKKCDLIIANNVAEDNIFDSDYNTIHIIGKKGLINSFEKKTKKEIASDLADFVSDILDGNKRKLKAVS